MTLLEAGRVGRPHGLDGSFHVTRPDTQLLAGLDEIHVNGEPARSSAAPARPSGRSCGWRGTPGARRRSGCAARSWRFRWSARRRSRPTSTGPTSCAGCTVVDGERRVGEVRRMLPLPSCEVLEVATDDGGELLVPMVRDAIRSVDVGARRIDVDLAFLGG